MPLTGLGIHVIQYLERGEQQEREAAQLSDFHHISPLIAHQPICTPCRSHQVAQHWQCLRSSQDDHISAVCECSCVQMIDAEVLNMLMGAGTSTLEATSSRDVNVFSTMSAAILPGLIAARCIATAPPRDLPKMAICMHSQQLEEMR